LHTAHGGPDACVDLPYSEMVEKLELCSDHVENGHDGEGGRVWFPGEGIDGGRASRAIASPENVCANDEELISVDSLVWSDKFLPPTGRRIGRG
jgi:hypothetical protein